MRLQQRLADRPVEFIIALVQRFPGFPEDFPCQRLGNVDRDEMYHVFNMGIGMVVMCPPGDVSRFTAQIPEIKIVGEVQKQAGEKRVV